MPDESKPPSTDHVRLDHFLKLCGAAETGGQAKMMIQAGDVFVNGEVETRRRKKLIMGDVVFVGDEEFVIESLDD
ncbi:RNA-binding S4 domain-containing protein [Thalassoglobus sp.]|uniref:RNA-binding S4 domain-containing protein n=1 Tax=Thalassoglobus sp. TaxID=2795869 RepID=UPI003AA8E75C